MPWPNLSVYHEASGAGAGLYDQRLDETQIMMLYQAVQAANVTKALLALGNSETLPQPAPPPSPAGAMPASAPVVCAHAARGHTSQDVWLLMRG